MLSVIRTVGAFLAGYLISAISSILFFRLSHHDPHNPAPGVTFIIITVVYGVVFAIIAGYVAAFIDRYRTALAVAVAIVVVAALALMGDPHGSPWTEIIAMVAMAPAAVFGGKLRVWHKQSELRDRLNRTSA
jgi:peptidoglycan/LPS O-acetylase OafA/YrhL